MIFLQQKNNNSSYITPAKNVAQLSAAYNFADLGLGLFADVQVSIAENISVFSAVRATYKVTSNTSLNTNVTANIDSETVKVVAYPFAAIKIPLGTIRTGVRVNISKDGYTGLVLTDYEYNRIKDAYKKANNIIILRIHLRNNISDITLPFLIK